MDFDIGDTIIFNVQSSTHYRKKGFIFLTFNINAPNFQENKDLNSFKGVWVCSESGDVITLGDSDKTIEISYSSNLFSHCRILLCEKNMDKQIKKKVSKKFSSYLISHLLNRQ